MSTTTLAVVAIGRNEGQRLIDCLDSLLERAERLVYVDSGSTDDSCAQARARGVEVVDLDMEIPFTAARARNAGVAHLAETGVLPDYIQFVDGDCVLQSGWLETGRAFLDAHPDAAVVCGRNRERFPERSIYNWLADIEWDTPVGETTACGGNAMMRTRALQQAGGFNPDLIAGEEPELCLRMRRAGWTIWRLDAEMTLHDAALLRFGQWWRRLTRSGYATTEAVTMYGRAPERHGVRSLLRIFGWAILLPLIILIGLTQTPWALLGVLIWPLQVLRLRLRGTAWSQAVFLQIGKFAEAQGMVSYLWRRLSASAPQLIEHK